MNKIWNVQNNYIKYTLLVILILEMVNECANYNVVYENVIINHFPNRTDKSWFVQVMWIVCLWANEVCTCIAYNYE